VKFRATFAGSRLVGVLALASLLVATTWAAEPLANRPKLDPTHVRDLADSAFAKLTEPPGHFTPRAPKFMPAKHAWWVLYIQNSPPYIPDGDMLVVVDDETASTCSQNATWPGKCT
jgi:hypothetical protein